MTRGRLIVFEGPDGAGKTTLHALVSEAMPPGATLPFAFPGHRSRSLGKLVYEIHHGTFADIEQPSEAALQLLHVAAHLDAIERVIRPTVSLGTTVLLDRYWWSTWVYGVGGGVSRRLLEKMIDVEKEFLADLAPDVIFLLVPPEPHGHKISIEEYKRLSVLYRELAQQADCPVEVLDQPLTRREAMAHVTSRIASLARQKDSDR